jgi:hypothetical protein
MDQEFDSIDEASFDADMAADVLERLAQIALDDAGPAPWIAGRSPVVTASAGLLRDSKTWLERNSSSFDSFPGDAVLAAHEQNADMLRQDFVAALRGTAIVIIQIGRLIEHRAIRGGSSG